MNAETKVLTDRIRFALSQRQLFGSDGCAYVVVPYTLEIARTGEISQSKEERGCARLLQIAKKEDGK